MAITPKELFNERVPRGLAENPERVKDMPLVLQFNVTGSEGGHWTVDTVNEPASCKEGVREDAQCSITLADKALTEIISAEPISRPQIVMRNVVMGTIEIEGDVTVAMKLSKVFSIADTSG